MYYFGSGMLCYILVIYCLIVCVTQYTNAVLALVCCILVDGLTRMLILTIEYMPFPHDVFAGGAVGLKFFHILSILILYNLKASYPARWRSVA